MGKIVIEEEKFKGERKELEETFPDRNLSRQEKGSFDNLLCSVSVRVEINFYLVKKKWMCQSSISLIISDKWFFIFIGQTETFLFLERDTNQFGFSGETEQDSVR